MDTLSFILIGIAVIVLIVIGIGFSLRCPECKKWWSKKDDGSVITSENTKYETVTRYDIHKNKDGKEISRTERKEQVRVEYTHYLNYHSCKNCGNKWKTTSCDRRVL